MGQQSSQKSRAGHTGRWEAWSNIWLGQASAELCNKVTLAALRHNGRAESGEQGKPHKRQLREV